MVDTISLWDRARSLGGKFFGGDDASPESDAPGAFGGVGEEVREMHDTIADRIAAARATAAAANEDFSIEHYRKECVAFAETPEGERMVAEGKWTPASYANLSGQDLHGIRLTNPQAIRPEHTLSPAIQADYDGFNRDGDGQINSPAVNQFYDRVTFDKKTDLRASIVDPATSFNEEIAKAGNVDGLTINNLSANDPAFVFGACNYTNINMTNINGGEVIFGDNTRVNGLNIQGTSADVTMGNHAMVSNIRTSPGFSIVNLSMGEGSVLANSNLTNATISMASEFEQGGAFQNVQFGRNVAGLDFSGLELKNVSIDGVPIQRASDLAQFGVGYDPSNPPEVTASPEMVRAYDLAQIRATMQDAVASIGSTSPTPAAQMAKVIAPLAASDTDNTLDSLARAQNIVNVNANNNPNDVLASIRASAAATAITFGGDANFNTVTQTAAVTSQPRTIDPNDVPNLGSGNMNVGNA